MSLAVAQACPDVQVIAVEADPAIAEWFRRNLALNPTLALRITLVAAAATDRQGEVAFASTAGTSNVGTGHVTSADAGDSRRVPAIAIGPWLGARGMAADVVKIDVEGGELEVLAGLWRADFRPDAIMLETHGHMFPVETTFNERVLEQFTQQGYDVDVLGRGVWRPVRQADVLGPRAHVRATRVRS